MKQPDKFKSRPAALRPKAQTKWVEWLPELGFTGPVYAAPFEVGKGAKCLKVRMTPIVRKPRS